MDSDDWLDNWLTENTSVPAETIDTSNMPYTEVDDPLDKTVINLVDPFPKDAQNDPSIPQIPNEESADESLL